MKMSSKMEAYRVRDGRMASHIGRPYGAFDRVPGPCGLELTVIADDGDRTGWEHVSVSSRRRIPNWLEMSFIKDMFWEEEDCVVQFHPPRSHWVNNMSTVLHMWRCRTKEFPTPPDILVGIKELGTLA